MQVKFREGHLVIVRDSQRVTQYRLPRAMHLFYGVLAITFLFYVTHPVVTSLVGQSARELDGEKMLVAADLVVGQLSTDANNAFHVTRPQLHSQLATVRLEIPNNTLQEMQWALKHGDPELNHELGGIKPYFKAMLLDDVGTKQVKICLRGSMHWHHRTAKPSFRIKIKKDEVSYGDRYIELTTPEDSLVLINWLPMQLAGDLGLMTDASEHVRLFINEKYYGVYVRSIRQGEPFALANQRMPGTFFKAEFSEQMWQSAQAWKTFGQQEREDLVVLQRWLDILAGPRTATTIEQLDSLFDTEKFARWAALMTVVGSIHTDDRHNHSYFYCPNQGKLEPMPWDCNGFGLHTQPNSPVDVQVQPVLRFLSSDPRWVHRRNQWIHHLITRSASTSKIRRIIDDRLSKMYEDLMSDRHLGNLKKFTGNGWHWIPASVAEIGSMREELVAWIVSRNQFLGTYLEDTQFSVESDPAGDSKISVFGSVAVEVMHLDTGETKVLYPGLSENHALHASRQQQGNVQFPYLLPTLQTYRVNAMPNQLSFRNAITHKSIKPSSLSEISARSVEKSRTVHIDQFSLVPTCDVVLGPGTVELKQDLIVGKYQRLTVCADTVLILSHGVGIYSRGKTRFEGTQEQPIQIRGSQQEPWAAIGISGPQTEGSVFEHVDVEGGSIGKLDQMRFKGMLNVYDCPQITLRHCRIGKNQIGDDAVNLAESTIRVDHCHWSDARADALDLDMCEGTVTNCRWKNSGNDGLDLMSCAVTVSNCHVEGSGDKGISVGENSRLQASRLTIVNCQVGTEIKDDSIAKFVDCTFSGCHIAVHSYQKKWFYAAGGQSALVTAKSSAACTKTLKCNRNPTFCWSAQK